MARARPDGTTLLLGTIAPLTLTPLAFRNPGFDPIADVAHVTMVCETLSLLVSHARWRSLEALLAAAQVRPGGLSFATWGVGTTAQLPMLDRMARTEMGLLHVLRNGAPPALTDTISGRTDGSHQARARLEQGADGARGAGAGLSVSPSPRTRRMAGGPLA